MKKEIVLGHYLTKQGKFTIQKDDYNHFFTLDLLHKKNSELHFTVNFIPTFEFAWKIAVASVKEFWRCYKIVPEYLFYKFNDQKGSAIIRRKSKNNYCYEVVYGKNICALDIKSGFATTDEALDKAIAVYKQFS